MAHDSSAVAVWTAVEPARRAFAAGCRAAGCTVLPSSVSAGVGGVVARAPFPLGVVMAPSHPLARKAAISVADCAGQPFLRSSGPSPVNSKQVPEFGRFWDAVEPHIACNSTPLLKRLIVAGKGIAFFSKIAFIDELNRGDLVWRPLDIAAIKG